MRPLLEARDLRVYYEIGGRTVRAVDGVSFSVSRGETLGLVGESGCGKTTIGCALAGLLPLKSGHILWKGRDLAAFSPAERRALSRHRQIVFQDPYASLDPLWRVRDIVAEPMRVHGLIDDKGELERRIAQLLEQVGLDPRMMNRYPAELSGGQRQRVAIARALSTEPEMLILDEPTAALDVSVRAQILNVLVELQQQRELAILLITHDFSVVQSLANRIAVMYLGKIVESGPSQTILETPRHPYTRILLASLLPPRPTGHLPQVPPGEVPDPFYLPSGCRFRTRCPLAIDLCSQRDPLLDEWKEGSHESACFRAGLLGVRNGRNEHSLSD